MKRAQRYTPVVQNIEGRNVPLMKKDKTGDFVKATDYDVLFDKVQHLLDAAHIMKRALKGL